MVRSYKPGSGLPDASTRWSAKQRALQERAQNRSSRDAAADVFSGEPAASAPLSPTAPVSAQHAQPLDLLEPAAAPPKAPWSHLQVSADRPVEFSFVAKAAAADAKALGSHQLTLFRVAQQAAANAKKAGSPGERLAALGALQRVLRDRALERNPSAQPIDFAAAVEKFNQALPEQWQRAEASRGS